LQVRLRRYGQVRMREEERRQEACRPGKGQVVDNSSQV
jgi:hypothetical protein